MKKSNERPGEETVSFNYQDEAVKRGVSSPGGGDPRYKIPLLRPVAFFCYGLNISTYVLAENMSRAGTAPA